MSQLPHEVREDVAWVRFDSGGMNTLSMQALADLEALLDELARRHATSPLRGVVLQGNRFGLGAGANIHELLEGTRADLERLIDRGNELLFRIEESPFPWLAVVDGFALGGIYELALACRAIVATPRSTLGFPEIRLNIFPGLGGTQRLPRRTGLVNASDPTRPAGFAAILQGRNFGAPEAARMGMIDALIPADADVEAWAGRYLRETLPGLRRATPPDLARAESLRPLVLPTVQKATLGRNHPRAPYVALDVMIRGATLPLREAIRVERDAFLEVAGSSEGKAGMRFFLTQQSVQKLPRGFAGKPQPLRRIAVDGADGYMGNAIAWLAVEAGYDVVAHVPLARFAAVVPEKLRAKYAHAVKRGKLTEEQAAQKVSAVKVTTEIRDLFDCDLVVEARMEKREIKAEFYRALGAGISPRALVASNSSSMGPGVLAPFFQERGGDPAQFLNLHFFSPAEHPRMQLVEIVRGDDTRDDAIATAHAFVRQLGKTPLLLRDGSAGFLVNAGLAAYFGAAEQLYREGTSLERIDAAIRATVLPMGPFELGDQAGLDIAAGLMDTIAEESPPEVEPLVWKMRSAGRFGIKSGGGWYEYADGRKGAVWTGLAALVPDRGRREAEDAEIVERCTRALHDTVRALLERGIVASEEEADLAFVLGIGFAMHLGGPLYYGRQHGWR